MEFLRIGKDHQDLLRGINFLSLTINLKFRNSIKKCLLKRQIQSLTIRFLQS
jgi:hypothetical protein